MDPLWRLFLLLLCAPTPPLSSHIAPPGLSCVSDYVRNITCDWSSSGVAPDTVAPHAVASDAACRIQASGSGCVDRSCALEPVDIPEAKIHRCGFACTLNLNSAVRLKFLQVKCGNHVMTEIRNFRPLDHIKMNPPGVPQIHTSSNHTSLSWGPGAPLSTLIFGYKFQVQIKQEPQKWEDSLIFTSSMLQPSLTVKRKQAGVYHVRVRVQPDDKYKAQWSDWSPSSWWAEGGSTDSPDGKTLDWTSVVLWCVMVAVFTVIVILLLICKTCAKQRKHHQQVPDPSKYFHTLNSVHDGNFQKWLSPMFTADDFQPALPCEDVSLLEVAEPVVPSTSTCTSATSSFLSSGPDSSAHGWSGGEGSGQSSSCFYNVSYFLSNHPAHQHVEPWPTYFTYEEDLLHPLHPCHPLHSCHPLPCLPLPRADSYELLLGPGTSSTRPGHWKEPSSPDSGISEGNHIPSEDEESVNDMRTVRFTHIPPLLVLPLTQVACLMHHGGTTAPSGLSQAPSPPEEPPSTAEGDSSLGVGGSYSAWPVDDALDRSSSMTVRPDGGGYLTIKELQKTCSKKSI